jgi:hypothetical protein
MLRRLLIPLAGSGLLLAATAGSAFAKCEGPNPPAACSEVVVSLPDSVGSFEAGTPETVLVSVSQGEQPFTEAMGVVLQFVNAGDGSRLDVPAAATTQPGLWRAVVTLPATGVWETYAQVVTNGGADYRLFVERVRVAQPPAPPAAKPVAAPPVASTPPILPIALGLAGLAAAALTVQAVRSRRRTAAAAPAASTAGDRA